MRTLFRSFQTHPLFYLLVCVLGIGVLTLYPFNFRQRNNAVAADGLSIMPPGTAYTLHSHEALSSLYQFTILLDVTPEVEDLNRVGRILSSAKDFSSQNFAIAQWHNSLNIQFFSRESRQFNEMTVNDVFRKGKPVSIAITFNGATLRCYLNGIKKTERRTGPMALTLWDAAYPLVVGTDPNGTMQWEGVLHTAAIFDRAFKGSELQKPALIFKRYSSIIHYDFDRRQSPLIPSTGTDTGSLYIPALYQPYDRITLFDTFHFLGRQRLYVRDIVANIIFFLPVGFFSATLFRRSFKKIISIIFLSAAIGASLSITVELLQITLPSRYSSMIDVFSNTTGTALGALGALKLRKKTAGTEHDAAARAQDSLS